MECALYSLKIMPSLHIVGFPGFFYLCLSTCCWILTRPPHRQHRHAVPKVTLPCWPPDDGSCVYVPVEKAGGEDVGKYVGNAVNNLFTDIKDVSLGNPPYRVQPFQGRSASQAEIKKLVREVKQLLGRVAHHATCTYL